jgi:hypothetical protein
MGGSQMAKKPEPKSGQLIQKGAPLPLVAPTGQEGTLYRLFRRFSTFPFFNRRYVESLKSAKEVIDAKSDLGEAIGRHQEIRGQLKDLGTTLERGREERSRQLFEEKERRRAAENIFKFEEKMQDTKNKLEREEIKKREMEQQKRKLQLAKELNELKKPPSEPEPPKKKTTRGRSEKQKHIADAHKSYEKEIERIEKMKVTAKTKTDLKTTAANELEKEIQKIENEP